MNERDLFIAAFEIDDESAQRAYLDSACAGDLALRVRVERLLNREAAAGDFLEQPAADLCSDAELLTEPSEPEPVDGDPPTVLGKADDTEQTIVLNPNASAASTSKSGVASTSQSGLAERSYVFGTLFGRYRVDRVLGSGGMGVVYLAEDLRLGRRVALKIPKFHVDADDRFHLIERFRREARTMASVLHRNLCPIFDVDEQDGTHYLTMAFIDGDSLAQVIKRGSSFTAQQIADLIRKLALALDEAHRAGIVHRDLKPANVMFDRSGEPIVMDFGLAWMGHETDARVTQSGAIIGTPAYMSPEQAEGDPDKVGASSDIYSLGAILYELLAGRPIHTGGMTRVLFKLMHERPIPPSSVREGVDPNLEAICWKAISRSPEDRFVTAAEFAEALARFLEGWPWEASPTRSVSEGERSTESLIPSLVKRSPSLTLRVSETDRTEVLPPDTSAETIAFVQPGEPAGVCPRSQDSGSLPGTNAPRRANLLATKDQSATLKRLRTAVLISVAVGAVLLLVVAIFQSSRKSAEPREQAGQGKRLNQGNPIEKVTDLPAKPLPLLSEDYEWTEPENLGPNINSDAPEDHACVSADGLQLIFVRRENGVDRLWWSVRATPADSWNVAQRMPDGINSNQREQTPFLSADGLSLWFASNRNGGSGQSDLYVARRETPDGAFGPAISLGKEINTAHDETSPFVSADGLTLLFGRGAPRIIYQSTRPSVDVPFPQATVLANVNSGKWHEFPRLTRNGLHLLFVGSTASITDQGLVIASREKITDEFGPPQSLGKMFRTGVVSGPSLSGDDSAIYFSAKRAGLAYHDLWVTRRVPKGSSGGDTRVTDADGQPLPAIAPFGSKAAREFQNVWAKHLNVEVETTNSIGMKLRLIPPGEFLMGAPEFDSEAMPQEKPQHSVTLTKPFLIGATEVTIAQFRKFVEATKYVTEAERDGQGAFDVGSKNRRPNYVWNKLDEVGLQNSDEHPVRCVSWEDARQFCEWLGKAEGREYRLPTDAEWEFACRAGTQTRHSFGNEFDPLQVSGTNGGPLSPVAQFPANPFGLFDMHGNLNEICWDAGRTFTTDAIRDPIGPLDLSTPAVVRGGAVSSSPARLRSSQRYISDARRSPESNFATYVKGFRVAASVESAMPQTKVVAPARLPKLELGEQLLSVKNAAGLKLGDLDGDGDLDLFVSMLKAPCVMLRNDGRGHFTDSGQQLGNNASFAVALGDLDGDGDLDAYVCNSDDQKDAIWLNDGHGTFQRSSQSFPPGRSNDVALADIDGDKDLDIVVSDFGGPATIWINDKSGRFTSQQTIERSGNTGVALGDLDRDGDVDLVLTSFDGDNRVWFNDSHGHFTDSDQQIELAKSTSVALGDLDRDGHLDLFLTANDGSQVWFNNGKGHFQASEQRLGDSFCEAVELLDLDADHDLDAVSISGGFETPKPGTVWRNDGQGRFARVPTTLKSGRTQALAVGDLDGDGDPDVVFGSLAEPAEVWLNPSNQSTIP